MTDPFIFKKDYAPYISKSIFKELEIDEDGQAVLFTTIVIPDDYKR